MVRVAPGDPDNSFLTYKLDADDLTFCEAVAAPTRDRCGTSMPQGGPRLPEEETTPSAGGSPGRQGGLTTA